MLTFPRNGEVISRLLGNIVVHFLKAWTVVGLRLILENSEFNYLSSFKILFNQSNKLVSCFIERGINKLARGAKSEKVKAKFSTRPKNPKCWEKKPNQSRFGSCRNWFNDLKIQNFELWHTKQQLGDWRVNATSSTND